MSALSVLASIPSNSHCSYLFGSRCVINRNAVRNRTSLNSSISHQATPITSLLGFVYDTPTTCWVLDPVWHVIEPRMFDCNP